MIGVVLFVVLVAHVVAHVVLVVRLRTRAPISRVVMSLVLTPLAPWFGFRSGLVRTSWVWIGTLALYACLVGFVRGCV